MNKLYRILTLGLIIIAVAGGGYLAAQVPGAQAATAAADIPEIVIQGHDFAFSAPDTIEAGQVGITLANQGHEPHQANIARLQDGKTFDDLLAAFKQSEMAGLMLLDFVGGPNTVDPGASQRVVVTVDAGTYVLLCFVPSADGVPHIAKGMVKPFTVTARADQSPVAEPHADATTTLRDFAIELPTTVNAGKQIWKVTNAGPQPHEFTLIKLAPGKTMADFMAFMQKPEGAPPFADVGGMGALMIGKSAWMSLDLQPGDYIALCFVPDPASGKAHVEMGMHAVFSVAAGKPVVLPQTGQASGSTLILVALLGALALIVIGGTVWLRARKAN